MATLTYDFEADSTGSMPSGWQHLYATSTYTEVVASQGGSKRFQVTAAGPTDRTGSYCTDAGTSVSDVIVSGVLYRNLDQCYTIVEVRRDDAAFGAENGYSVAFGNNVIYASETSGGSATTLAGPVAATIASGVYYNFKVECTGTTLRAKIWTGAEPGTWNVSVSDSAHSSGRVVLGNYAYTTYFDDLVITSDDIVIDVDVAQDPVGEVEIQGYSPSVYTHIGVHVALDGTLQVDGYDPVVVAPTNNIQSNIGSLEITGYNPTVSAEQPQTSSLWFKFRASDGVVRSYNIGRRPSVQTVTTPAGDPVQSFTEVNEDIVLVDATNNAADIRLPQATGREGFMYWIKKIDSSANAVVVTPVGAETIDGAATQTLSSQHEVICVVSDGSDWWII